MLHQKKISPSSKGKKVLPFLKWAGGKRWIAEELGLEGVDVKGRYIEPFLGSGAVFFCLHPARAILSDSNEELIRTYQALKDNWMAVYEELEVHHRNHSSVYYYKIRSKTPETEHEVAARFIYLNRTCWNGLYRVNLRGEFNVPIGTKDSVLLDSDDFQAVSRRLKNATLLASDFEEVIDSATAGDLIFADPPYTVRHNLNGFVKYNERLFSWDDQIRLRDALLRAKARGAQVLATNADHSSVSELYAGHFDVSRVSRFSAISSSSVTRGRYSELVIHCGRTAHG